jgi:lipopolysaccharide transport system ATP-binding protein
VPDSPRIVVDSIAKCYRLYARPRDRLAQFFLGARRQFYRESWALRGVSFSVGAGETLGVIGLNGSGKSTLLQIVCGTLEPTEGTVEASGRVFPLLELGTGFNPEFSGRENVRLTAGIYGVPPAEMDDRVAKIEAFAEIGDYIDQPVKTYSTGMYVRLAFSVAANLEPDILLVDEVFAVGDVYFVQKCMRYLRQFRMRGTLILVSHDMGAITSLCDRALWLDRGTLRRLGPAKEVCDAYLAAAVEARQGESAASVLGAGARPKGRIEDPRWQEINRTDLRNELRLFAFDDSASGFGRGGARVRDVFLSDESGRRVQAVTGGEVVRLSVLIEAAEELNSPIVGFILKDRLGQALFSDNTYLTYRADPPRLAPGQVWATSFTFQMPILPRGDYAITVAVADGTQEDNVQHHWIHDALVIRSVSSSVCTGLVGIPMLDINMRRLADGSL